MPLFMMMIFLAVVFSASLGLHYYLLTRLELLLLPSLHAGAQTSWMPSPAQRWSVAVGLALLMCCYFLIGKFLSPRRFRWLAWISSIWMGFFALSTVWAGGFHLLEIGLRAADAQLPLHSGLLPVGAAAAMTLIGVNNARQPPELKQVTLHPERLPEALDGIRIVQLSDIHVGPTIGRSFLQDVVDRTLAQAPDLIVITGDLVDGTVAQLSEDVAPLFQLKAPLGVFFITGNHEFISGADPWVRHLRANGITVLDNSSAVLEHQGTPLQLVGVEDWDSERFHPRRSPNLTKALQDCKDHQFTVLLAHQPKAIQEASERGIDLQLSGHTHGGQFAPFSALVVLDQPYRSGLYTVGGSLLYVNEGTGYWGPPIRIGTRSEITELTLRAVAQPA